MLSIDFAQINYLAVLVAAVASFVVGGIWYAAIFAKPWVRLHGFTKADTDQMAKQQPRIFATFLVSDLVMGFVLSILLTNLDAPTALSGAMLGTVIWFGFQAPHGLSKKMAENRPLALYGIDTSHQLACLVVMGLIIGAWH